MIFADAHVHIYDCFDPEIFFDSALRNFESEARRCNVSRYFKGVLFLTETASDNWFDRLGGFADEGRGIGQWTFWHTGENESLCARNENGQILFIIAGRQIVTEENLEVLALAAAGPFSERLPMHDGVERVRKSGGIPVIPWGCGKWLGHRGKVLTEVLKDSDDSLLFLGDNGGRPVFWPTPFHFQLACQKGIRVLPGSDPLPFAGEEGRVGSFGFSCAEEISGETPAKDLRQFFMTPETHFQAYGRLETPLRFMRNQFRMQMRKHLG